MGKIIWNVQAVCRKWRNQKYSQPILLNMLTKSILPKRGCAQSVQLSGKLQPPLAMPNFLKSRATSISVEAFRGYLNSAELIDSMSPMHFESFLWDNTWNAMFSFPSDIHKPLRTHTHTDERDYRGSSVCLGMWKMLSNNRIEDLCVAVDTESDSSLVYRTHLVSRKSSSPRYGSINCVCVCVQTCTIPLTTLRYS